jgi:hypothetical protein
LRNRLAGFAGQIAKNLYFENARAVQSQRVKVAGQAEFHAGGGPFFEWKRGWSIPKIS